MAVNSSSSFFSNLYHCSDSTVGYLISLVFAITHIILLLPLSLFILYLGHQRWRQQCSFATTSHSDIFTYQSAAMDLIYTLGFACSCCGIYFGVTELKTLGFYATSNLFSGQICFHILTCVERYLAVVHPVVYLRMRQSGGVRIRNISIGCAWLLYCGWIGITALYFPAVAYIPFFCLLVLSLVVVAFCSFSVLCVLIRPGPGATQVDQTKQRAFHTMIAITGVLWLYFIGMLVSLALDHSNLLSYDDGCLVLTCGYLVSLPSSLVLPLLFLHRTGKLFCCHSRDK